MLPYKGLLLLSRPDVSNSLQPHGLQHARPPCSSPSPGVCSNSCPLHWTGTESYYILHTGYSVILQVTLRKSHFA